MKRTITSAFSFLFLGMFSHYAMAEKWTRSNNPDYFIPVAPLGIEKKFHLLPLKAEIADDRYGWSETYWPSSKGGIAYRWNSTDPRPFNYALKTKAELFKMSTKELEELSPAELYDIAMGDYSYTLTRKVLSETSPKSLWWEGICHGWSLAASHYPEPNKVEITNRDGLKVPFGSSDVKGLLSLHDAYNSKGLYVRVGERCRVEGKAPGEALAQDGDVPEISVKDSNKNECSDVNPGAFHIVLASMIGINSQGFVADVDRYNDVWNQPITSYESEVLAEMDVTARERKKGIERKIKVKTIMNFGEELIFYTNKAASEGHVGFVSKEPVTGTPAQTFKSRTYNYILELNQHGEIIGGEWISESRPDMLWLKKRDLKFLNGKFPLAGLNVIYQPIPSRK
jgi:hypothetical protein